ncbi:hypothetical protein FRC17_007594 [Serendipita sp. 399]|nr:hypothetical protein FRC17_007594 [Serendipita sp. 399]
MVTFEKIRFAPNEDELRARMRAKVQYLWRPFISSVGKTIRQIKGEADQNDVGNWVRQRPESTVVVMGGGIPKGKLNTLSVYSHVCNPAVEDYVANGAAVARRKAQPLFGPTTKTVPDHNKLSTYLSRHFVSLKAVSLA